MQTDEFPNKRTSGRRKEDSIYEKMKKLGTIALAAAGILTLSGSILTAAKYVDDLATALRAYKPTVVGINARVDSLNVSVNSLHQSQVETNYKDSIQFETLKQAIRLYRGKQ